MLTIDLEGARDLLDLLQRVWKGYPASKAELEKVLTANAFIIDFYRQWEGCDREVYKQVICHFVQPEQVPPGRLPTLLAKGFRQAIAEMNLLKSRMSWLDEIDASNIAARVLDSLPVGTPLDSTIHITVDLLNNAFMHRREMGVSLLKGATDRMTFEDAVTHELHHVGFQFWSERDAVQQVLAQEQSGRAVAMLNVQNLLSEGMANYYCTPGYVFRAVPQEPPADPYQTRLARLHKEEDIFFAKAEAILATSLEPGAEYEPCWEAFKTIAFDIEEMMLPAGHYLGARMLQTMEKVHPRDRIVRCVQHLPEFLPLYNEAARKVGAFVFSAQLSERFALLWS